jgi:uncharacterized membrane protein
MTTKKQKALSFTIALIYVGLGTIWILTSHGVDTYYFDWPAIVILILPVTAISFAIRFGTEDYLWPVMITQIIMFFAVYLFILRLFKKTSKKRSDSLD